ncbi:Uncharacterised protein [Salmonella enterica subsp. enterica serovar Bovismorbificans]|nr:Uncharacterised protein [Salmonella enterica subsp. enterica serovar Bovismorbificans]
MTPPAQINSTIAKTLMAESQYSHSPKLFAEVRLMAVRMSRIARQNIYTGTAGKNW